MIHLEGDAVPSKVHSANVRKLCAKGQSGGLLLNNTQQRPSMIPKEEHAYMFPYPRERERALVRRATQITSLSCGLWAYTFVLFSRQSPKCINVFEV